MLPRLMVSVAQMHISCYADPKTQESKKRMHIVNMLKLMAESWQAWQVSLSLDMGYVDANGKEVKT